MTSTTTLTRQPRMILHLTQTEAQVEDPSAVRLHTAAPRRAV
jgi:hypothetical protein